MTAAVQVGEVARDRADLYRRLKTGATVLLHDNGIVGHSKHRNTLKATEPKVPCGVESTEQGLRFSPEALGPLFASSCNRVLGMAGRVGVTIRLNGRASVLDNRAPCPNGLNS